jgi:hypothetical protein
VVRKQKLKKIFKAISFALKTYKSIGDKKRKRHYPLKRYKNLKKNKRIFILKKKTQNNLQKKTHYFMRASKCTILVKNNKNNYSAGVYYTHHHLILRKKDIHRYYVNLNKYKNFVLNFLQTKKYPTKRSYYEFQYSGSRPKRDPVLRFRLQLSYRLRKGKKRGIRMLRKFRVLRKRYKYGQDPKELLLAKRFKVEMFKSVNLRFGTPKKQGIITYVTLVLNNVRMYEWGVPDDLGEPSEESDEPEPEVPVPMSETTEHVINLKQKYKNGEYTRLVKLVDGSPIIQTGGSLQISLFFFKVSKPISTIKITRNYFQPHTKKRDLLVKCAGYFNTNLNKELPWGIDPMPEKDPKVLKLKSSKFKKKKKTSPPSYKNGFLYKKTKNKNAIIV